jgi:hypothetical protein
MIEYSVNDGSTGFFKYRKWAEYLASWIFGVPITLAYLTMLIMLLISDLNSASQLNPYFYLMLAFALPMAMVITSAVHLPILNPHWIFTEVRTLIIKPNTNAVLRMGFFPICIQKTIARKSIKRVTLYRHNYGKGLGFLYFWLTQGHLHSLCIVTNDNKRYYVAINEVKDGWLAEEGRKLSEFLNIPFESKVVGN